MTSSSRPSEYKNVQTVSVVALIATVVLAVWGAVNLLDGRSTIFVENFAISAAYLAVFLLNRRGRHRLASTLLVAIFLGHMAFSIYAFGYDSGGYLFLLIGVVVPYLIFDRADFGRAHVFAALAAVGFMVSVIWQDDLPVRYVIVSVRFMEIFNSLLVVAVLVAVAVSFVVTVKRGEEALQAAHRRAHDLLLNVLPEAIAERLQANPDTMIADHYGSVSVMFVDIAGFTERAETQTPEETVTMLNGLFTAFDRICERLGVEKIRTIGDGYMAVAGAPVAMPDHQATIVEAGLSFLAAAGEQRIDVRIGAHCGELVAGIVGVRRFQFDIWGDTVNVAARMETTGEIGRIHVSGAMIPFLEAGFVCIPRGSIAVKGKGTMETWFVEGLKS